VPGAGLHPGNVGWGGAATTSPLPAIGSEAAEADLSTQSERADAMSGSYGGAGPMPVADLAGPTVDYSAAPAPSVDLGRPIVVGRPDAVQRGDDTRDGERGGFSWEGGQTRNGGQAGFASDPLGTAASVSSASGVVVPPAEHVATENRLPIFEAVESDWFRRGRSGVATGSAMGAALGGQASADLGSADLGSAGRSDSWPVPAAAASMPEPEVSWTASVADRGWEAAAAVSSPTTGGTTEAGLPKRVPQANLVPGTASPEPLAPAPARSASATRDRFSSFQRGVREGRAAVVGEDAQPDGDDGSQ
jgi:hypothetical protein